MCLFWDETHDFTFFGMAARGLFAIDQVVANENFEDAAAGREQGEGLNRCLVLFQNVVRQTDGTR